MRKVLQIILMRVIHDNFVGPSANARELALAFPNDEQSNSLLPC